MSRVRAENQTTFTAHEYHEDFDSWIDVELKVDHSLGEKVDVLPLIEEVYAAAKKFYGVEDVG